MKARAATPPTTPPTIAPMFEEELLLVDVFGEFVPVPVELEVVVVSGFDEVVDDVVDRVSESSTSRGWSSMEMIVCSGKQRYMDFCGMPGQRNVPQAPQEDSVLDIIPRQTTGTFIFPLHENSQVMEHSPASSRGPNARTCVLFKGLIVETGGVEWRRGSRNATHHVSLVRCASVIAVASKRHGYGIQA